jgi:hypothetical protein
MLLVEFTNRYHFQAIISFDCRHRFFGYDEENAAQQSQRWIPCPEEPHGSGAEYFSQQLNARVEMMTKTQKTMRKISHRSSS